jgi:hypothetical protein
MKKVFKPQTIKAYDQYELTKAVLPKKQLERIYELLFVSIDF